MAEKYVIVTPGGGFGEFYDDSEDAVAEALSQLPTAGILTVYVPEKNDDDEDKEPEAVAPKKAKKTEK